MIMTVDARLEAIRVLCDGRWHSGETMASALGISRAAVWQRLQGLSEWGLQLQAVRGRGYRLAQAIDLLDLGVIRQHLSDAARRRLTTLELFPVLDSTNAWQMARNDDTDASLCLAEYQTAGRGRRGRAWQSPFGANLYLSLAWRFAEMPPQLSSLGLAVGVGLVESLRALGHEGIGLKWPNDLLWQGRKLAGILIEHRGEGGGPARVVVGVGVNVAMSAAQANGIDQPWVSLAEVMRVQSSDLPDRNLLCARLVSALVEVLDEFSVGGFGGFARRWAACDVMQGQTVGLEQGGRIIQGIARGIDHEGALMLEIEGRLQRYLSGDVSLRRADA